MNAGLIIFFGTISIFVVVIIGTTMLLPITNEFLHPELLQCKENMKEFCEDNGLNYMSNYYGYYCNEMVNDTLFNEEINCNLETQKVFWIKKTKAASK